MADSGKRKSQEFKNLESLAAKVFQAKPKQHKPNDKPKGDSQAS